jgi:hypothetical protein
MEVLYIINSKFDKKDCKGPIKKKLNTETDLKPKINVRSQTCN